MLAACVSGLHWWAIDQHPSPQPAGSKLPPSTVLVMSAAAPPPAQPEAAVAGEAARAEPGPPAPVLPPRRVTRAPEPPTAAIRPAFHAAPQAEAVALPVVLPADETILPIEPVAPPAQGVDAPSPGLVAQASPTMRSTDAPMATPADPPVPTYRTRPPAAAMLAYRLARSGIVGTGHIDWRPVPGGAYSLQLEGSVPIIGTLITQTSRGRIDAAGLAPERHTDKRLRRGEQAANFDRAAGAIRFSGQAPEVPLTAGVQDRLSVMIQLPAIVNAWTRLPPVGEHLLVRVIGARGDAHVWSLRFEGPQAIDTPDGRVNALRFLREPEGASDTRAEFWLDPQRQHLPAKVVLTDGKGESLELLRTP